MTYLTHFQDLLKVNKCCAKICKKGNFNHMFKERKPIKDVFTRPQFSNKSKMMKFAIFIVAVFSFASAKLNMSGKY